MSPDEIQLHASTQWAFLNQEREEPLKSACTHAVPGEAWMLQIISFHFFCGVTQLKCKQVFDITF